MDSARSQGGAKDVLKWKGVAGGQGKVVGMESEMELEWSHVVEWEVESVWNEGGAGVESGVELLLSQVGSERNQGGVK